MVGITMEIGGITTFVNDVPGQPPARTPVDSILNSCESGNAGNRGTRAGNAEVWLPRFERTTVYLPGPPEEARTGEHPNGEHVAPAEKKECARPHLIAPWHPEAFPHSGIPIHFQ
jgi:hypothetical protein